MERMNSSVSSFRPWGTVTVALLASALTTMAVLYAYGRTRAAASYPQPHAVAAPPPLISRRSAIVMRLLLSLLG